MSQASTPVCGVISYLKRAAGASSVRAVWAETASPALDAGSAHPSARPAWIVGAPASASRRPRPALAIELAAYISSLSSPPTPGHAGIRRYRTLLSLRGFKSTAPSPAPQPVVMALILIIDLTSAFVIPFGGDLAPSLIFPAWSRHAVGVPSAPPAGDTSATMPAGAEDSLLREPRVVSAPEFGCRLVHQAQSSRPQQSTVIMARLRAIIRRLTPRDRVHIAPAWPRGLNGTRHRHEVSGNRRQREHRVLSSVNGGFVTWAHGWH